MNEPDYAQASKFFADHVDAVLRTESLVKHAMSPDDYRLLHSVLGMLDELGEIAKALKAYLFYGKPLDPVNLSEEFGDFSWYQHLGLDSLNLDPAAVLRQNIEKLRVRYPEKFTSLAALNRDLDKERTVLEDTHAGADEKV